MLNNRSAMRQSYSHCRSLEMVYELGKQQEKVLAMLGRERTLDIVISAQICSI